MTVLQLQLNNKHGFLLTSPKHAKRTDTKLLEGALSVNERNITLADVELATIEDKGIRLNTSILAGGVGDIRTVVQQLRYFMQAGR